MERESPTSIYHNMFSGIQNLVNKNFTNGTHRVCEPQITYEQVSRFFEAMGITRIADVTGLDVIGIPVCVAIRPNSRSLTVSQGKGISIIAAKVSAAMESIELYHAETIDLSQTILAPYSHMRQKVNVCDPKTLNLHPNADYSENMSLRWIKGFDVIQFEECFVPYDLTHCAWVGTVNQKHLFHLSSNGLASGNHFLEAMSHAICEIIERHETHLWRLLSLLRPYQIRYVDLDTVNHVQCRKLIDKLGNAGLKVYVWHMSSISSIPVFGCVILESSPILYWESTGVFHGFGCHLSKEIAFIRAVTEAVQTRLTFISGSRDDNYREDYILAQSRFFQSQWMHLLTDARRFVDYAKLPSLETDRIDTDIVTLLRYLKMASYERVVVVNLTKPEFDIPVVRVIIPGMKNPIE